MVVGPVVRTMMRRCSITPVVLLLVVVSSAGFGIIIRSADALHIARPPVAMTTTARLLQNWGGRACCLPQSSSSPCTRIDHINRRHPCAVSSSSALKTFYNDFEDFDQDDDDEDDDDEEGEGSGEYENLGEDEDYMSDEDRAKIEMFRTQMMLGNLGDFGDDDDEDDDDDDDDEMMLLDDDDDDDDDEDGVEGKKFSSVEALINFASGATDKETDWAVPLLQDPFSAKSSLDADSIGNALRGGVVLLANPAKFCSDIAGPGGDSKPKKKNSVASAIFGDGNRKDDNPHPALLSKFGLTLPPPPELGPDRRADLLPVLMLVDRHPMRGSHAVLLNRRTGYLMGDLETTAAPDGPPPSADEEGGAGSESKTRDGPPKLGAFMIQPLWFGGTSAGPGEAPGSGGYDNPAAGLDMLHQCPAVPGCSPLTEDGLYWGGDPYKAQDAMVDPSLKHPASGFEFKFFVQSTRWLPQQLEKEVKDGTWFVASVGKDVLFKSRDRLGTKRAKPLWTEIMELLGDKYNEIREELYAADGSGSA